jgi:eukaryotic-like serine/threonine-protein kinase
MSLSSPPTLPLSAALQVDSVCERFESAWKAANAGAERPKIETFLAGTDGPARAALIRELLRVDVHYRRAAGDEPNAAHYRETVPGLDSAWLASLLVSDRAGARADVPNVPGYQILGVLGRGGMGVVYRARQLKLNRMVALKMILAGGMADTREIERFRREAEAVAQLQHPNIVQIHEVGDHSGNPYLALEFVDGTSLDKLIAHTPYSPRAAARLVEILARAIQHAHERGVIHRDLKPANILLNDEERRSSDERPPSASRLPPASLAPKITDFGLAKLLDGGPAGPTRTGDLVGTPSYMAPEQAAARAETIGPATDVYGLGAIMYELLTGRPPFQGESAHAVVEQVCSADPVMPRRLVPGVPRDLETIALKCLNKDPRRRYASALALAEDLERFQLNQPIQARPAGPIERTVKWVKRRPAVATALAAVAAVIAMAFAGVTWEWQQTQTALKLSQHARDELDANLYVSQIGQALREWEANHGGRARAILDECQDARRDWEWRYLDRLCRQELFTLRGHTLAVRCVAFSPDGRTLASGSGEWGNGEPGEVKLWNAATGQELNTLTGHDGPIMAVAFSPDSKLLATVDASFTNPKDSPRLIVWNVGTGKEVYRRDVIQWMYSVAFSPDGKTIAAGAGRGQVFRWEAATGNQLPPLLQSGSIDFAVVFTPDGQGLAAANRDGNVRLWDLARPAQPRLFMASSDARSVAVSPDNRYLAAANWDQTLKIWDLTERGDSVVVHNLHAAFLHSTVFSPSGRHLACSTGDGTVKILDVPAGGESAVFRGHEGPVYSVAFSPDGQRLATSGWDRTVRIWNAVQWREPRTFIGHSALIASLAFTADGSQLIAAGGLRHTFVGAGKPTLQAWDFRRQKFIREYTGATKWLTSVACSPDGRWLAAGSEDNSVLTWEIGKSAPKFRLQDHSAGITAVAFSPDGQYLASSSRDHTIVLWDVASGRKVRSLLGHTGAVTSLAFCADGGRLISGSMDHSLRLWDVEAGTCAATFQGHGAGVNGVACSPKEPYAASSDVNQNLKFWNLATLQEIVPASVHVNLAAAQPAVNQANTPESLFQAMSLTFTPDGKRLVSGGGKRLVQLWEVPSGREIITLPAAAAELEWVRQCVAVSPDGEAIVAARDDEVIRWDTRGPSTEITDQYAKAMNDDFLNWHWDQAKRFETLKNWFATNFHRERVLAFEPSSPNAFFHRGQVRAIVGQWELADADFARAIAGNLGSSGVSLLRGLLRCHLGDKTGYQAVCRDAVQRYGSTKNPTIANIVVWTCTLAPDAGVDLARLTQPLEDAVKQNPKQHAYLFRLGAAHYRTGRLKEAVRRMQDALAADQKEELVVPPYLILAMAHHRLGDSTLAREFLEKARSCIHAAEIGWALDNAANRVPVLAWADQIGARLLLHEAEALLE